LSETKALFIEKGFIDQKWRLVNWNKRQFVSDSSKERVAAHRQRKKKQKEPVQPAFVTVLTVTDRYADATVTPPDTDTDTDADADADKPSSGKPLELTPASRHEACKEHVHAYWRTFHPDDKLAPWDGGEAKRLKELLDANPGLTAEGFRRLLHHRAKSEVNHSARPRDWLARLTDFKRSPLDRFGKPKGDSSGTSNEARGAAVGRVERGIAAVRAAAEQFGWPGAGDDGRADGRLLPAPGDGEGDGAGLHARPEPARGDAWLGGSDDGLAVTPHPARTKVLPPPERGV
jgi:hypothetical protein